MSRTVSPHVVCDGCLRDMKSLPRFENGPNGKTSYLYYGVSVGKDRHICRNCHSVVESLKSRGVVTVNGEMVALDDMNINDILNDWGEEE
jgi:hypothetical protein